MARANEIAMEQGLPPAPAAQMEQVPASPTAGAPEIETDASQLVELPPAGTPLEPGERYVGVMVELKNVADEDQEVSLERDPTILTAEGRTVEYAESYTGGECSVAGNPLLEGVTLAPGETAQGCLPYVLTEADTPRRIEYSVRSEAG